MFLYFYYVYEGVCPLFNSSFFTLSLNFVPIFKNDPWIRKALE